MAKPQRPRDPVPLATLVVDMATGEMPNHSPKGWRAVRDRKRARPMTRGTFEEIVELAS